MANGAEKSRFIVPIEGSHITDALAVARQDAEAFRKGGMEWLRLHHSRLQLRLERTYGTVARQKGIESADALMMGVVLGDFAVRSCTTDAQDYGTAKQNYWANNNRDSQSDRYKLTIEPQGLGSQHAWSNEAALQGVFGDDDMVQALLDIRHPTSRHAAAVTIGYYTLAELPAPAPVAS